MVGGSDGQAVRELRALTTVMDGFRHLRRTGDQAHLAGPWGLTYGGGPMLSRGSDLLEQACRIARLGGWRYEPASGRLEWTREVLAIHELPPGASPPSIDGALACFAPVARSVVERAIRRCLELAEPFDLELLLTTATGRAIWVRLTGEAERDGASIVALRGAMQEVTDRRRIQEALRSLVQSTSAAFGSAFAQALVAALAQALKVRTVLIGRISPDRQRVRTIARWDLGGLRDELSYDLAGTPCRQVLAGTTTSVSSGIRQCFPDCVPLEAHQADGYFAVPLYSGDRTVLGHLVVLHDRPLELDEQLKDLITLFAARAEAEIEREIAETGWQRSEDRYRTLIDAMAEGMMVIDGEARITACNRQALDILGVSRIWMIGASLRDPSWRVYHPDGRPMDAAEGPISHALRTGQPSHDVVLGVMRGDDTLAWLSVSARPIAGKDDTFDGLVVTFADISSRLAAERALRDSHSDLERRVAERTWQLAAANGELESFCYSVSHDLRAPLRAIDGFSQALEEDCGDRLDDHGRDHLHRVRAATRRMGQLIDDLLRLSRLTRQQTTRQAVDLSELARSITDDLAAREPERRIDLRIDPEMRCQGDPALLRIALENLLGNAWKYTAQQAAPVVSVSHRDGVFTVADNGAGFDMAYADRLFVPFQRLHDAKQFDGNGIGLAIVARVMARHGGRIWAEATSGQGARFHFTVRPDDKSR